MKSGENMSYFSPSNLILKRRIGVKKAYISKKLTKYFSGIPLLSKLNSLSNGATFERISDVRRLGGVSNEVYSFFLTYRGGGHKQQINLVLKIYGKALDPVLRRYVNDENLERCVKEFQVLGSLERVGFPAPRPCLCERDSNVLGYPFIIMLRVEPTQNSTVEIDCFANSLARLHSLDVTKLGIGVLKAPKDELEFARRYLLYLRRLLNLLPSRDKALKKDFEYAISWLESRVSHNGCTDYCLLHGDYRAGINANLTED